MFDFLGMSGNYEDRKVARDELDNGLIVSTADTSDEGFETAILDKNGTHPVERYKTKNGAINGHKRWVEFAKDGVGKEVTKLGWLGVVEPETITLEM